jgi:hypothetical protein
MPHAVLDASPTRLAASVLLSILLIPALADTPAVDRSCPHSCDT